MALNINNKIEEIRNKPEHIRLRYVWLAVAISMLFIVSIWVISLKETFSNGKDSGVVNDLKTRIESSTQKAPSLKELVDPNTLNSGDSNTNSANEGEGIIQ